MATEIVYPTDVLNRAAALHGRIITFDSHIDLPLDFGAGNCRADVDGPSKFDLVKAARGKLRGATLTVHSKAFFPTPANFELSHQHLEARYRMITGLARDFPDRV